jgi:hypothetical protein
LSDPQYKSQVIVVVVLAVYVVISLYILPFTCYNNC